MERFMTVAEVCDFLRLSRNTVRKLLESGEIPSQRFGRSYRIDREKLEQKLAIGTK